MPKIIATSRIIRREGGSKQVPLVANKIIQDAKEMRRTRRTTRDNARPHFRNMIAQDIMASEGKQAPRQRKIFGKATRVLSSKELEYRKL